MNDAPEFYVYRADTYCSRCIRGKLIGSSAEPNYPEVIEPDALLTLAAEWRGIDRDDERSFDSDDFPKGPYVARSDESPTLCGRCGAVCRQSPYV